MSIPKLLLKSEYIEKNLSTVKEAIDNPVEVLMGGDERKALEL